MRESDAVLGLLTGLLIGFLVGWTAAGLRGVPIDLRPYLLPCVATEAPS